jgi:hypothetical protein
MSLYRQPTRLRAPVLAGAVVGALLVGGAIGYAIGHSNTKEPSAADVVARLHSGLRPVGDALQLLPTEYPQAARGAGNESAAVTGALGRLDTALGAARADLVVLDPADTRTLQQRVAALEAAVRAKEAPVEVAALTRAASDALAAVPGGSGD